MLMQNAIAARGWAWDFQSSDFEAVLDYVSGALAPHQMRAQQPENMKAKLRAIDLDPIQVVDIEYGTPVSIDAGEIAGCYFVHMTSAGQSSMRTGGLQSLMTPGEIHVSSPNSAMGCQMSAESRHLTVKLPASAFEEYLNQTLNIAVSRPLVFYPDQHCDRELPLAWQNVVAHLIDLSEIAPAILSNSHIRKQYAQVLVDMLLNNYSNSYSEQIALYGNDISPWHVRRAREIIHASLEESISVTELAKQVGVSVRSLQNGFRQFLGQTPVEYVRQHRLEKLHSLLMECGPDSSVTELMLDSGIVNFGRYAQYYRQQYGCRPSEALRARRFI